MYVDDDLAGAHDVKTAIKARDEPFAALSSAGFPLIKWTSNSNISSEYILNAYFIEFEDTSVENVRWSLECTIRCVLLSFQST